MLVPQLSACELQPCQCLSLSVVSKSSGIPLDIHGLPIQESQLCPWSDESVSSARWGFEDMALHTQDQGSGCGLIDQGGVSDEARVLQLTMNPHKHHPSCTHTGLTHVAQPGHGT